MSPGGSAVTPMFVQGYQRDAIRHSGSLGGADCGARGGKSREFGSPQRTFRRTRHGSGPSGRRPRRVGSRRVTSRRRWAGTGAAARRGGSCSGRQWAGTGGAAQSRRVRLRSPRRPARRTISMTSFGSSVTWMRSRSSGETIPSPSSLTLIHSTSPLKNAEPTRITGKPRDLAGLDERQRLEQLVHRPVATGEDHEPVGVLHEHRLAREEVPELDPEIDVRVDRLLVGQLDVAADREAAALLAAAIRGLHDARPAAGDDRVALLREESADLARHRVRRVAGIDPRRAEHRDRRADRRQRIEALDELREDSQRAPGVGVQECGSLRRLEELAVLGHRRVGAHLLADVRAQHQPP